MCAPVVKIVGRERVRKGTEGRLGTPFLWVRNAKRPSGDGRLVGYEAEPFAEESVAFFGRCRYGGRLAVGEPCCVGDGPDSAGGGLVLLPRGQAGVLQYTVAGQVPVKELIQPDRYALTQRV